MFKRPHHQRIQRLLQALDGELFARTECYFGGGTAIVLALGEHSRIGLAQDRGRLRS